MKEAIPQIALIYFAVISVVTAVVTVTDKYRARKTRWRVRESTLFTLAVCGGSFAEYITMKLIHHKTLHKKFMIGLPLIFIAQAALVIFIYMRFYA